jgi:hypothetical protein
MLLRSASIFALALALPLSAACELGIDGSGHAVSERREVAAFTGVSAEAPFDVHVEVVAGARTQVEVHCDDNLVRHIETEVRGGTLHVRERRNLDPDAPCFVAVTTDGLTDVALEGPGDLDVSGALTDLHAVRLDGPGDLEVEGIAAAGLEVDLSGPGDLDLQGRVDELHVHGSGPGDVQASDLEARAVFVIAEGPGDIVVRATEACTVALEGPGDVVVLGAPNERHLHDGGPGDIDFR